MKIRQGFVSNSSSTVYIITNKTDKAKRVIDFVRENPQLVQKWNDEYGEYGELLTSWDEDKFPFICGSLLNYGNLYSQTALEQSAIKDRGDDIFEPHTDTEISFGDEDHNAVGQVFDYILREGGESESFIWRFSYYNR